MTIVTVEDVKNETGIDLSQELGKSPQLVNKWLERQQREILHYIARYAWGGIAQAEAYLCDPRTAGIIKQAILEQIEFLAHNNFIEAKDIADKEIADKTRYIAPLAHDILIDAGLLYTGAH